MSNQTAIGLVGDIARLICATRDQRVILDNDLNVATQEAKL